MYASKNGSDEQGANYKIMLVSKYIQIPAILWTASNQKWEMNEVAQAWF